MGRGSPVSGRAITPIQTGQSAAASHMIRPRFAISFGRLAFPMQIGTGSPSASAINGRPICALMPLMFISSMAAHQSTRLRKRVMCLSVAIRTTSTSCRYLRRFVFDAGFFSQISGFFSQISWVLPPFGTADGLAASDSGSSARGSQSSTVVPSPTLLWTRTSPPD